jgi:hypothetical protein
MALYNSAQRAFPDAEVFVAATNDTSSRPFPFAVKEKLAKLAGVEPGHFVQVKSPFRAEEITSQFDPDQDVLIFVRSEKDAGSPPQPGGVKKDGSATYLQPLLGAQKLEPFAQHAYMAYLPTVEFGPGMTSATEIRTAWPTLNEKRKTALVMSLYPATQKNPKLAQTVVRLLDAAIGTESVAEASGGVSVRKWAAQVRKDHGADVKFRNRQEGGGAVDSVIAKNSNGETVGVYNRKTGYPTVYEPKQAVAKASLEDRLKKYVRPVVKTTPKIERTTNPAGRTTDHVEWKVTGPMGDVNRFSSKKAAQAHYDSFGKPGVAKGSLKEFAVSGGGDDDGDDSLFNYAKMWYNGDLKIQRQVEKALQKSGLDIGENEDENGGAYISDRSGDYYESWTSEDLEGSLNEFAPGDGDDEENPLDDYPCYDCGSTIYMHHTRLCDFAEDNAVRDLPAEPGTQYWTGRVPKGLKPIPGLSKSVDESVEFMSDAQFYGEILSVLAALGAGLATGAYLKVKDIVKMYNANQIMRALEGHRVSNISDSERRALTKLLAEFKQAMANRQGEDALAIANRIKSIATDQSGVAETVSASHTTANTSGAGAGMTAGYQRRDNQPVDEGWKDIVAGSAMALGALGASAQSMPNINAQQVELTNKYYKVLVQRAVEDGRTLDARTKNFLMAKAQDAAAQKIQKSTAQSPTTQAKPQFPSQGSEQRRAKDFEQFESQDYLSERRL